MGRILLEIMCKKSFAAAWTDLTCSRIGAVGWLLSELL